MSRVRPTAAASKGLLESGQNHQGPLHCCKRLSSPILSHFQSPTPRGTLPGVDFLPTVNFPNNGTALILTGLGLIPTTGLQVNPSNWRSRSFCFSSVLSVASHGIPDSRRPGPHHPIRDAEQAVHPDCCLEKGRGSISNTISKLMPLPWMPLAGSCHVMVSRARRILATAYVSSE